jgi:hypothetical protein
MNIYLLNNQVYDAIYYFLYYHLILIIDFVTGTLCTNLLLQWPNNQILITLLMKEAKDNRKNWTP